MVFVNTGSSEVVVGNVGVATVSTVEPNINAGNAERVTASTVESSNVVENAEPVSANTVAANLDVENAEQVTANTAKSSNIVENAEQVTASTVEGRINAGNAEPVYVNTIIEKIVAVTVVLSVIFAPSQRAAFIEHLVMKRGTGLLTTWPALSECSDYTSKNSSNLECRGRIMESGRLTILFLSDISEYLE